MLSASNRLRITKYKQNLAGYHERFEDLHDEVFKVLPDDADLEPEHAVLEDHEEIVAGLEERLQPLQILSAPGELPDQSKKRAVDPVD